ncbi:sensor histidine kinase [Marinobacterium litorale]|uniref:sensor histidine kinase n=1 Tax=Marinobacterium litorale TaxID=404770 RepID=UPI00040DDB46|nr:HAMP domain-containing sensor histidine kinase [Marinobacterium litorale]
MKRSFTSRLISTVGISTLVITSLYWLIGWHYVEELESGHQERVLDYMAERFDMVAAGELPAESLQFMDIATLYSRADKLPESLRRYADPVVLGVYEPEPKQLLMIRASPRTGEPYFVHIEHLDQVLVSEESGAFEAALVVGGILLFTLGAMGLTLTLVWFQTRPVRELTQAVAAVDPANPGIEPLPRDDDLGRMSRQISDLLSRIAGFIDRERNFTRFASHELRSPLMAMRSAVDLLRESGANDPRQQRALGRIDMAVERMSRLVEAFLWLSREPGNDPKRVVDSATLDEVVHQIISLHPELEARLEVRIGTPIRWRIDPFVLSVILDNLLRNALDHGEGVVELDAEVQELRLDNRVAQRSLNTSHFGYGLQIVKQMCESAGCEYQAGEEAGHYRTRLVFQPAGSVAADCKAS